MRLNPIAPSDDPLYESLYCFGGGDSGGDSGGSADDADSMDSGYDTSTVGMGTNTMGSDGSNFGRGDSGGGNDDPMGMASLAAEASKAQPSTNVGAANAALAGLDGGGGDGGAAGPALIDSYLSGPMLADISTPMMSGSFVDPMTGQGIMQDIPSGGLQAAMDAVAAAQGRGAASPSGRVAVDGTYEQGSLLGQVGPTGEQFDYTPDDIFGDLTPEQLAVQEYVSGLKAATPAESIISEARSAALAPEKAVTVETAPVKAATVEDVLTDQQKAQQERAAAAAVAAAQQPGKTAEQVTEDISNALFGGDLSLGPAPAQGIASLGPVTDVTKAAGVQSARDAGVQAARDAFAAGQAAGNLQPTDRVAPATDAIAAGQQAARDAFNRGVASGSPTPTTAAAATTATTAAMEDITAAAQPAASTQPSNIDAQTGLPVSVRQANAPTFGTVPNYDETDYLDLGTGQDLVSARQAAVNAGLAKAAEESPINTGIGIIDNIYNSIMAPNTTAKNMVMEDGAYVAYDMTPEQNVIGAINTQTGAIQPTRGNFFNIELNPYYDQYGRGPEGGDNGGQTTMPQEVAPVAPQTCPDGYTYDAASDSCVYQGVARVQRASYGPETRTQYAYTGLPTLAPSTLRPSFQARGQYSPLFPMNFR